MAVRVVKQMIPKLAGGLDNLEEYEGGKQAILGRKTNKRHQTSSMPSDLDK